MPQAVRDAVIAKATSGSVAEVRDLFERFLPEEKRTKRLGAVIKPAELLALPGNVEQGRKIFFEATGIQCRNCHKIQGTGIEVGPDLSEIAKQNNRVIRAGPGAGRACFGAAVSRARPA